MEFSKSHSKQTHFKQHRVPKDDQHRRSPARQSSLTGKDHDANFGPEYSKRSVKDVSSPLQQDSCLTEPEQLQYIHDPDF